MVIALREPLLRPDGGNTNWEYVQSALRRHLQQPEARAAVATFYETLAKRKDSEYRLNSAQFDKFVQVMEFLSELMVEHEDYSGLSRLVYYTQYFCTIQQIQVPGQDIGEFKALWMATKYLEMKFIKESKWWEQSCCWLLHEALFEQRDQEPWRLFVNIYYRNLPVFTRVVPDAEKRSVILKETLLRCDLDETPELVKKLQDISKIPVDEIEVNFAIKKAFVGVAFSF